MKKHILGVICFSLGVMMSGCGGRSEQVPPQIEARLAYKVVTTERSTASICGTKCKQKLTTCWDGCKNSSGDTTSAGTCVDKCASAFDTCRGACSECVIDAECGARGKCYEHRCLLHCQKTTECLSGEVCTPQGFCSAA